VLLAVVVGALFFDPTGWAVKVLIVLVGLVAGIELSKLTDSPFPNVLPGILLAGMIFGQISFLPTLLVGLCAVCAAPLLIFSISKKKPYFSLILGTVWVCTTIFPLFVLASTKNPLTWPLLMTAAIPIWCGDTAAIFVGKAFGKHKLAPSISPNKTWEGSIGNFLACILAAVVLGFIFKYPLPLMLLLGVNCGVLGQAGDLFESWMKRNAGVKDSGSFLPGHGGILDRVDSLMATAPLSLLILQSLVVPGKP
jgi:phosphatidate cytidylyltransferase